MHGLCLKHLASKHLNYITAKLCNNLFAVKLPGDASAASVISIETFLSLRQFMFHRCQNFFLTKRKQSITLFVRRLRFSDRGLSDIT